MDRAAREAIVARYPDAGAFQRWHMRGRLDLCPYDALLPFFTGSDSVLDVGCGFGHLAWHLSRHRPDLRYYGTDIDARKVALAESSLRADADRGDPPASAKPSFFLGDARIIRGLPGAFGNITFLDVLYLLPWESQQEMIRWALGRLKDAPGSSVIIKTMDEAKGFAGFRAVAEEWIMVRMLRRTLSSGALNGARPAADYLAFAGSLGFRGEAHPLGTFNPSTLIRLAR
jgi:SAM-dependent methyltransferase